MDEEKMSEPSGGQLWFFVTLILVALAMGQC